MCRAARSFLAEKGITYKEVDVSKDGKARYRVKKLTGRTRTPVFLVGEVVVPGFDRAKLEALLGLSPGFESLRTYPHT